VRDTEAPASDVSARAEASAGGVDSLGEATPARAPVTDPAPGPTGAPVSDEVQLPDDLHAGQTDAVPGAGDFPDEFRHDEALGAPTMPAPRPEEIEDDFADHDDAELLAESDEVQLDDASSDEPPTPDTDPSELGGATPEPMKASEAPALPWDEADRPRHDPKHDNREILAELENLDDDVEPIEGDPMEVEAIDEESGAESAPRTLDALSDMLERGGTAPPPPPKSHVPPPPATRTPGTVPPPLPGASKPAPAGSVPPAPPSPRTAPPPAPGSARPSSPPPIPPPPSTRRN
jgi:hypothetical protein